MMEFIRTGGGRPVRPMSKKSQYRSEKERSEWMRQRIEHFLPITRCFLNIQERRFFMWLMVYLVTEA